MNKFENGLEHVKVRISKIEDEIYSVSELRERSIIEKCKFEDEIFEISEIEQLLSELYDELYRISNFHESNNALIVKVLEVELREVFKEYHSNKLKNLYSTNFLEFEQINNHYQNSRELLINKLKDGFGGDFLRIEVLSNIIRKIIKSNEKILNTIFQVENLYKILLCFANMDLLVFDPFSELKEIILPSFSNIIGNLININDQATVNHDSFNITQQLIEKFYFEKLMNYICELIKQYWTPLYFKETENLAKSIYYIQNHFQIKLPEIIFELLEKLQVAFNFLISEYSSKPNFEYKFTLLVFNWVNSLFIVTRIFEIKQEQVNLLLNKTIINFSQNIQNYENENFKKLLCETEFDIQEVNNCSVQEQELDSSQTINSKIIDLLNINEAIYQITNSFKLNFTKKKYILIDIILEIISSYNLIN